MEGEVYRFPSKLLLDDFFGYFQAREWIQLFHYWHLSWYLSLAEKDCGRKPKFCFPGLSFYLVLVSLKLHCQWCGLL